jgi:hypothetical protein
MKKRKLANGRPAKITAKVVEEIGAMMALGVPEDYACALHGINPATFGPAVSRSEAFKNIMRVHHARFMAESLQIIKEGGERIQIATEQGFTEKIMPWSGRAWILERRYKPHFTRTDILKGSEAPGERGGLMSAEDLKELEKMGRALVKELS